MADHTTNPGTGAGGKTGPPGAPQPTKPVSTIPAPGKIKAQTWNSVGNGAKAVHAYDDMRTTYVHTLPGIRAQFEALAHRPIGG